MVKRCHHLWPFQRGSARKTMFNTSLKGETVSPLSLEISRDAARQNRKFYEFSNLENLGKSNNLLILSLSINLLTVQHNRSFV